MRTRGLFYDNSLRDRFSVYALCDGIEMNAYGLSRTRDEKGKIIKRALNDYVNCLTPSMTGGTETRWVLVVEVYEDNRRESCRP